MHNSEIAGNKNLRGRIKIFGRFSYKDDPAFSNNLLLPQSDPVLVMRGAEYAFLQKKLQISPTQVFMLNQAHTNQSYYIHGHENKTGVACFARGDALFSMHRDVALVVRTADCLPLLFSFNSKLSQLIMIGAIHAGWRGMHKKIIQKVLAEAFFEYQNAIDRKSLESININEYLDSFSLEFAIGPCIGEKVYQVGADVARYFEAVQADIEHSGKFLLDLKQEALDQIQWFCNSILKSDQIRIVLNRDRNFETCTLLNSGYFSHRANDKFRNLNVIQII